MITAVQRLVKKRVLCECDGDVYRFKKFSFLLKKSIAMKPRHIMFILLVYVFSLTDFIARQRVMHAERDIVLPLLSVCPSVSLSNADIVSKRMDVLHFLIVW